jgi:hypothetical protein
VWTGFVDGNKSFEDLDNADKLVQGAAVLQIAVQLAAVIMVCLWSNRIAANAKARGAHNVRPGLAAGGWVIPIGWFWVGFTQLRKAVDGVRGVAPNLRRWQVSFIVVGITGFVIRGIGGDIEIGDSASDVTDKLGRQGAVGLVSAILFAVASYLAMRATKEIDDVVTGPSA